MAPPPPLFSNGSLLAGRFRILRRIGEGGMGVVYEAYDVERQMLVALKCITHPDPTAIFRFKREFRTLADISHPNLVSLYELVSDGEQWFFTMELVEGTDLARYLRPPSKLPEGVALEEMKTQSELGSIVEREAAMHAPTAELKRRPDPQREATKRPSSDAWDWSLVDFRKVRDVFAQLASAVQALHEANRLHRDLKPSNVLVRPNGAVVVLDFGLVAELERADAELRADPSAIESPGSNEEDGRAVLSDEIVTGTIPYMAPEQVTGEPLTTACDWYALGVMLYQVCTGRLPHEGAPSKILANKVTVKPIAPRAINPATPADLDALCMHLLAQRPTDRPNAVEILERLRSKRSSHRLSFEFDLSKRLFIGRAPQLSELAASYARSREGRAVVCSLRGAHGSGKTALIEHAMRTTLTGATVLRGRCFEHETVPLKTIDGVIDAMLRHVTTLTTPEAEALVPEGVAALVAMFPVLARSAVFARAAHDRPAPEALSELRSMAVDALRSLMFELARSKPLVIVIDDVHWGDVDGVRALSRLWDPPTIPMLTVLAYRPELEGASPALIELSKQRSGRPELPWSDVDLREFSREEARMLVRMLLARGRMVAQDDLWVERMVDWSGGNPWLIELLLESYVALGAIARESSLDALLRARAASLSDKQRDLLEVVCISSTPLTTRVAFEASFGQLGSPDALAALNKAHLTKTTGPTLDDLVEPFHPRVREAIVRTMSAEARAQALERLDRARAALQIGDPSRNNTP